MQIGIFRFLGTGASSGVPVIGCPCAVCHSTCPKNRRLRPSALLEIGGKNLLIDAGPDFRSQALLYGITHLDGLLLTHTHYDHIAGIDELRIFYLRSQKALPCLLSQESFVELQKRYHYLFQPIGEATTLSAQLEFHILEEDQGAKEFLGIPFSYGSYLQGGMKVLGFRVGSFAYVSDIADFDDTVFVWLQGTKTLVLSALRETPSPIHLSIEEAVAFAVRVGAAKTFLTHLSHEVDYEKVSCRLPENIFLGVDGQTLPIENA